MTYNEQETAWNNLQRPITCKKQPETAHNDKDTTYNDLNIYITSKEKTPNDQQQADFKIILLYGPNGSLL